MSSSPGAPQGVRLYDTTLRDGLGMEGLSLSVEDKIAIARRLDEIGVDYVEGGYPGSNPKDAEFFARMRETPLRNAKLVAFGSTRRVGGDAASDPALRAVLESETPAVTLVGKSSAVQVREVLETTEEENLAMIADSVRLLVEQGREVIFDAEHFFDGYADDPRYAIATLRAAAGAGAGAVALCDTNGGSMPGAIVEGVGEALRAVDCAIGIHVHNDADLAVANTLLAVQAGATQVQACLNGWGERCGNANIISVIANLKLKLGLDVVSDEQLGKADRTLALRLGAGEPGAEPAAALRGDQRVRAQGGAARGGDHEVRRVLHARRSRLGRQHRAGARLRAVGTAQHRRQAGRGEHRHRA